MPKPYISKKSIWDASGRESSWDAEERKADKPKLEAKYNRRCRSCGMWLTTYAEDKIGVHIACVQTTLIKQRTLPRGKPQYGTRQGRD